MREYIELGSTPAAEDCAQVGAPDYYDRMREETRRYIEQLYNRFTQAASYGCAFVRKSFPHDFGTYHEVCISYDDDNEDSIEFAYFVEENIPEHWDDNPVPLLMNRDVEDRDRRRGLYGPEYPGESF